MDYYSNQTYYDILGLPKNGINDRGEKVSIDSIERAYNRIRWQEFRYLDEKVIEAYSVLSDVKKREEYDRKLEEGTIEIEQSTQPEEVTPEEVTPEEVTPEEVIPEEVTPEELTPKEVTPEEVTPEEATPEEVTPEEVEDVYSDLTKNPNIVPFTPVEKKQTKEGGSKLKTIGKYVGGIAIGSLLGPIGVVTAIVWLKKHKKVKLQKDKKTKKITKISTEELGIIEQYNKTLDQEINKLLGEPHNNYKLEINRLKYENQIKLMEGLLKHKLSKEVKKSQMLKHKLDLVGTKIQLETAKKNLEKIEKDILEYEQNQKTANISKKLVEISQKLSDGNVIRKSIENRDLTILNEKIIENNEEINSKSEEKSFGMTNLKAYQTKLINKRNKKGTKVKTSVLRRGKFYDDIRKAKDFMVSLKYVFKNKEEIDEFLQEGPRMTR